MNDVAYAERLAELFKQSGLPPMAGRILAWLLICDPPHRSQQELADELQASMGSISTMNRLLMEVGLIERFTVIGERRDFYRLPNDVWHTLITSKWRNVAHFRQVADEGLAMMADQSAEQRARLKEFRDTYAFF